MNEGDSTFFDVRTSALLRITLVIETATTLDELLMLALSQLAYLVGVPRSGILLWNEGETALQLVSTYPPRVTLPPPLAPEQVPSVLHTMTTRHAFQIADIRQQPQESALDRLLHEEGVATVLLMPLVAQDRVMGALGLATLEEVRTFTEAEISLIRMLTGPLAVAIYAFHITEAARRRSAELATLNDIAAAITSSLDTREIYHMVVRKLNEFFRVDAGSLLMLNDETGALEFVVTLKGGQEKLTGMQVPKGQGVAGQVAITQQYEIVTDAQHHPHYYPDISEHIGYPTRSILCVPMLVKGRTIGVIELLNKLDGAFTDKDATLLMRMASTIGVAIENARLFQQVATGSERLAAILNSTTDGILMADMHGYVQMANSQTARLFGISVASLIGRDINDLLDWLRSHATGSSAPAWLNDGSDETGIFDACELELSIPQQNHISIRYFSLPVYDAARIVIGQLLLFQDISKERELARLRDDFTGMLVHDLRAPLTAIMNGIMMVRRGLGGPVSPQQEELLTIAYQSSQTMLAMVNNLLDISKMEQGHMSLTYEPISPYELVEDTLDRLRLLADERRIQFLQHLQVGLPLFEADRDKTIRVLQNLLDNAIKFSPRGSAVEIGMAAVLIGQPAYIYEPDEHGIDADDLPPLTEPTSLPMRLPSLADGEWIVCWVRDRGSGIPAKYHDRIFEKFGQIQKRRSGGTGFGLTFCKLAVEAHGGHIWLESAEGQGSTFALALPVMRDPAQQ